MSYPTAWLMHHKAMKAMADREAAHRLCGAVEVDDAYLGGERAGGKPASSGLLSNQTSQWSEQIHRPEPVIREQIGLPPVP